MNYRNRYITIIMAFLLLLPLSSCKKDWLDVNTDPNNPARAEAEQIFPAAIASSAVMVNLRWNICGGYWAQHWTQGNSANQYNAYDQYNLTSTNFTNEWTEVYAGALNDLKQVKMQAEEVENHALILMSEVMSVYLWQYLVDLYNDIPYSEALNGFENSEPSYDTGEEIYTDLIARLDAALENTSLGRGVDPGANDFIFGGAVGIDNWIAFANTLKLKLYLRQVYANESAALAGINQMFSDGATFLTTHAAMTQFADEENKSNPLYEEQWRGLNTANNIKASLTLWSYLNANGDNRVNYVYEPAILDGVIRAQEQGGHMFTNAQMDHESISRALMRPLDPVYFMSAEEAYFLLAEARLRTGTGDTKAAYDAAVTASFTTAGIGGEATALIGTSGAYEFPAAGFDAQLEAIMMQKWVALAVTKNGLEAFIEIKRTGYPTKAPAGVRSSELTYIPGQLTEPLETSLGGWAYPSRFLYPTNYTERNSNAAPQARITDLVWWDIAAN